MILYRVFSWSEESKPKEKGGALYNPRPLQLSGPMGGRHDIPDKDGILYCSETAISPVAEALKPFINRKIKPFVFRREGKYHLSLIGYQVRDEIKLADLDDPSKLASFKSRSSHLSTSAREITQALSERIYEAGYDGFKWPSVIDGSWINVSIFYKRSIDKIKAGAAPIKLDFKNQHVIQAAKKLMIGFDKVEKNLD